METLFEVAAALLIIGQAVTLALVAKQRRAGLSPRDVRGKHLAELAVRGHPLPADPTPQQEIDVAAARLRAFQLADMQDNGRRDFNDAQARVLLNAAASEFDA